MNQLFQWPQHGMTRPMTDNGRVPEPGADCHPQQALILTGSGITDGNGEWTLTVPPALCADLFGVDWVSLVATPSKKLNDDNPDFPPGHLPLDPAYVTTAWSTAGGLTLYVKSWGPHGHFLPDVHFSWHAAVLRNIG